MHFVLQGLLKRCRGEKFGGAPACTPSLRGTARTLSPACGAFLGKCDALACSVVGAHRALPPARGAHFKVHRSSRLLRGRVFNVFRRARRCKKTLVGSCRTTHACQRPRNIMLTSHHATLTQGCYTPMGRVVTDCKPYPFISLHKLPIAPTRAFMLIVF